MRVHRIHSLFGTPASAIPWYLEGGIPESGNYTVYDPWSAPDLTSSYINLANPGTRNATPGVAPTLNFGWDFNGSTQYLNSGHTITSTTTIIIQHEGAINSDGYLFGTSGTGPTRRFTLQPDTSTTIRLELGSSTFTTISDISSGISAVTSAKFYRQGIEDPGVSVTWAGGSISQPLFIGAQNNGLGVATVFFSGRILRIAIYDFVLTQAQIRAVVDRLMEDGETLSTTYVNTTLALNPFCYWPLNNKEGNLSIHDLTGNYRTAYIHCADPTAWTAGQSGKYGFSIRNTQLVSTSQIESIGAWNQLISGLDRDEFSCSLWLNLNYTPLNQKILEFWGTNEYFACETRSNNQFSLFTRENGSDQNYNPGTVLGIEDTWVHLVMYNSLSTNKIGMYLNGTKFETAKTLTGKTTANAFMQIGVLDGYVQHVAFWDHALTQSEVNALQ